LHQGQEPFPASGQGQAQPGETIGNAIVGWAIRLFDSVSLINGNN